MQRTRKTNPSRPPVKAPAAIPESRESLGRLLREAGFTLDSRKLDILWGYHRLLREHNEEYDLTRLRTFPDFVEKHYLDCLIVPRLIRLPSPLMDIGTGAGFPGIPLKIAVPECKIILSESRSKRNEFLRMVIDSLKLEGIEVLGRGIVAGRPERTVAGVITRAVESATETLGRADTLLDTGGVVILMKGPGGESEIPDALRLFGDRFRLRDNIAYTLPGTRHQRRLIVFERTAPVPARRPVKEQGTETEITSAANATFKEWKSLLTGRGIRKAGLALVSGRKIISEVLHLRPEIVRAWIGFPSTEPPSEDLGSGIARYRLSRELYNELDVHGTGYPLLLVEVPPARRMGEGELPAGAVPCIPFQDPANVGAAIRTAAAFGLRTVVLLQEAASPYHPKSIRAAGTAVFLVEFVEGPSIGEIGRMGVPLVALSADGEDIGGFTFPDRFLLLPGIEGPGLPEGVSPDSLVRIPMETDVESLNAAVALSIAIYEWRRRIPAAGEGIGGEQPE